MGMVYGVQYYSNNGNASVGNLFSSQLCTLTLLRDAYVSGLHINAVLTDVNNGLKSFTCLFQLLYTGGQGLLPLPQVNYAASGAGQQDFYLSAYLTQYTTSFNIDYPEKTFQLKAGQVLRPTYIFESNGMIGTDGFQVSLGVRLAYENQGTLTPTQILSPGKKPKVYLQS